MNKTTRTILAGIIVLLIIVAGIFWYPRIGSHDQVEIPSDSISDGNITIPYSADAFGLAVTADQILVTSYIPPCSEDFSYCFYYVGNEYKNTNFDSAGLRMGKRSDLTSETLCLETPSAGYEATFAPVASTSAEKYRATLFPRLGDAATGHYAEGQMYRVYLTDKLLCYEFETRIGETRYENYPEGSIKQFTAEDKADVEKSLETLLRNITLSGDQAINFPRP